MFRLCGKILRLGYVVGFPLIIIALLLNKQVVGFLLFPSPAPIRLLTSEPVVAAKELTITKKTVEILLIILDTANCTCYVFMHAVTGTGNTRIAFIFQISTIAFYLVYLYLI